MNLTEEKMEILNWVMQEYDRLEELYRDGNLSKSSVEELFRDLEHELKENNIPCNIYVEDIFNGVERDDDISYDDFDFSY